MTNPFVVTNKVQYPHCFVGRSVDLERLAGWMSGTQPISANVVGERLSGKSSFLWNFHNTYAHRVPEPHRFLVVFICLRLAKPKNEAEFYQTLARALYNKLQDTPPNEPLRTALEQFAGGGSEFRDILELLSGHGLLPVFCIDEFEKLFDHKDTLGKDFYDGLHSLNNTNRMMLIIATRKPIKIIAAEQQLESAFFNFGQKHTLAEFSEDEAKELLRLPLIGPPALNADEQLLALKWGGRLPWQLQLAASFLFEARQIGKDIAWAKKEFQQERDSRLKEENMWNRPRAFSGMWGGGRTVLEELAKAAEHCGKILVVVVTLAGLVGVIYAWQTGKLTLDSALDWLLKWKGGK